MKKISISKIKSIREAIGATHLVLFAMDKDGIQHIATHGKTERDAKESAQAGNKLKRALGWDESLCHAKPLERICKNCTYYQPDYGPFCANGWSRDGSSGYCQVEPRKNEVESNQKCMFFEPKD